MVLFIVSASRHGKKYIQVKQAAKADLEQARKSWHKQQRVERKEARFVHSRTAEKSSTPAVSTTSLALAFSLASRDSRPIQDTHNTMTRNYRENPTMPPHQITWCGRQKRHTCDCCSFPSLMIPRAWRRKLGCFQHHPLELHLHAWAAPVDRAAPYGARTLSGSTRHKSTTREQE